MKSSLLPLYFVRTCRRTLGFSQAELAELLGVSRDVVANWETGRTIPRADVYITLKMVLTRFKERYRKLR
jgi:DNA-binding transcriptional regulator YiaG